LGWRAMFLCALFPVVDLDAQRATEIRSYPVGERPSTYWRWTSNERRALLRRKFRFEPLMT
jgi:hypothetical protein